MTLNGNAKKIIWNSTDDFNIPNLEDKVLMKNLGTNTNSATPTFREKDVTFSMIISSRKILTK